MLIKSVVENAEEFVLKWIGHMERSVEKNMKEFECLGLEYAGG